MNNQLDKISKKVLFISYFFPPLGGGGVLRILKFAKYLPTFGWQVLVVTPQKGYYSIFDHHLLEEIPGAQIHRVTYFEPFFLFKAKIWQSFLNYFLYPFLFCPDNQLLWFPAAFLKSLKLIKEERIKVIFTSSRSYTDHLVALLLKKFTKVKWVADFRDEWTKSPNFKPFSLIHRTINQFLERKFLKNADVITTISYGLTKSYQEIFPQNIQKFQTITNGFDSQDFPDQKKISPKENFMKIIYTGSLYGRRQPENLISAVKSINSNIKLELIGQGRKLHHLKAIEKLFSADVLVLILASQDGHSVLTGKIFEYLAARKPILALAPARSGAAQLIRQLKVGEIADPDNIVQIKEKIKKMYQKWQNNSLKIPEVNIQAYNRKNLTKKLAKIFDNLSKNRQKIKLCVVGNLQSAQNIHLVDFFKKQPAYEVHFITYKPNKIPGVKTYYLPHKESNNIFSAIKNHYRTARKIKALVSQIEPDILHGQSINFAGIWAYLSGFRPLAITAWGSDVINYEQFIQPERWLIKKTLAGADLLTGTSFGTQAKIDRILGYKKPYHLIHFGIDLAMFKKKNVEKLKQKLGLKNKTVIFCPRALKPLYNIDILLDAFAIVVKKYPDLRLALIEGNNQDAYVKNLKRQIRHLNLKNQVVFLSRVANNKMADYYNLAEVVVSIPNSDGCSVSFLEAMACEKKIVVSDLPYIKEWKKDNNLWVVPATDIRETVKAINLALNFPNKNFLIISRQNRKLILEKAEIKNNFLKLDYLYRRLI